MAKKVKPTADVAVSVLTYERPETTKTFFQALWKHTQHTRFDLFVVDNGSRSGTRDVLLSLPETTPAGGSVHLILLDENAGWCPGKNVGLAVAQGWYEYVCLAENDGVCRAKTDAYGPDWLAMHINALNCLGLDVIQGRHAPKEHPDEGYFWRLEKEGNHPCCPDSGAWSPKPWLLRIHDELLTRMLIMRGSVIDDVGGFNEKEFPMPLGMFADVEWSDRVLRRYAEKHGLIWGVSLDERIFEFLEINKDLFGVEETYPGEESIHDLAKTAHAQAFNDRRAYIWDHPDPDLFVDFSETAKANVAAFWDREAP